MKITERAAQLLSLEGKVPMVNRAASRLGRGIATRLAEMGAFVTILDIDETKGLEAVAEIGAGNSAFLTCDVRHAADCRRAVEAVIEKKNKIDILVNSAGIAIRKDVVELT